MASKKYRGVLVFGNGSKLKLQFNSDKCMAMKNMLRQYNHSKTRGYEYFNTRDVAASTNKTLDSAGAVERVYFEVWKLVDTIEAEVGEKVQMLD